MNQPQAFTESPPSLTIRFSPLPAEIVQDVQVAGADGRAFATATAPVSIRVVFSELPPEIIQAVEIAGVSEARVGHSYSYHSPSVVMQKGLLTEEQTRDLTNSPFKTLTGQPEKNPATEPTTNSISITQADHAAAWKDPFPSPLSELSVVRGIDVSRHQGAIDWMKVREDRVFFAYIKASQKVADPKFQQNWTGAESAGLFRGAYHFCDPSKTAQEQVQLFVNTVGSLGVADLPPVLDVEDNESIDWNLLPDGAARRALIDGWLTGVQTALGRRPMIYTNASFFDNWQIPTAGLEHYPLWIANPSKNPLSPRMPSQWNDWAIWQMSWTGKISGIKGDVDLNWFNGDGRRFIQFLMGSIL